MLRDTARAVAAGPLKRREHAQVMFLKPLVPTRTAAQDLKRILKSNVDLARGNLGDISVHKTPLGLTVMSHDLASVQKLKTLIEQNPVTSTAMSVRLVQQRKPLVKLTGVDPFVPAELTVSNDRFHKEVTNKLKDIHTTVTDVKRRLSKIEERLETVDNLSESVTTVGSVLQESQVQLKSIEQKQTQQANLVVDDLNNRMRRNNLVFKGIPEQTTEKWSDTEKLISEFVTTNLGIQPGEIERAHRVGQRKPDRIRPVVVKFLNFKDKNNILKSAFKLKDLVTPRVWIEEDFSPRMQLIRKTLRDFARANRLQNEKYKLQFDKLIMGNANQVEERWKKRSTFARLTRDRCQNALINQISLVLN
ncbi:hypothetical protein HPB49_008100 [Dermacentor silvarum]|uniref:Uncharacterized protein n=1 Tax=Dermacentor silvarum TaxID=543639 RepID=A0ACB8C8B6_DERSI|nr:hypothetical protein HPB49_008100 [Dermacentor silvarum]